MRRLLLILILLLPTTTLHAQDTLPSWKDTASRKAIVAFVENVCDRSSSDYVPPAERVAVFDNDGTLWSEQPMYVQLAFALDRIKALAPEHPEWKTTQPFQAVLEGDLEALHASGHTGLLKIIGATHAGMTTDEFAQVAADFFKTAKHPKYNRPYTECVYQPMLELLEYLRENQFRTYIVSGGGIDLMRVFAEEVYGIPPEQVVGSSIKTVYQERDGVPTLVRLPEVDFVDDKVGKPVGILKFIGRRPLMAFGNSDGDYEMLRYTTAGKGPRLAAIVHHTDDVREVAYDRESTFGKLNKALDEAPSRGWVVIDMKKEWSTIFPE